MQRMVRGSVAAVAIMASFFAMRSPAGAEDVYLQQEQQLSYESQASPSVPISQLTEFNKRGEFRTTLELSAKALYTSTDEKEQFQLLDAMTVAFDGMWKLTSNKFYVKSAIDALALQANIKPDESRLYAGMAKWNAISGDYPNAIELTKKALLLDASSTDNLMSLAGYYDLNKQYDEAIDVYDKFVKNGDTSANVKRGQCYLNAGRYKEAAKDFKKAIRSFEKQEMKQGNGGDAYLPEYSSAHYYLGKAYYLSGDYTSAARHYWMARELNIDHSCFDDGKAPWYGDKHVPTEQEEATFRGDREMDKTAPQMNGRNTGVEEKQQGTMDEEKEYRNTDEQNVWSYDV